MRMDYLYSLRIELFIYRRYLNVSILVVDNLTLEAYYHPDIDN